MSEETKMEEVKVEEKLPLQLKVEEVGIYGLIGTVAAQDVTEGDIDIFFRNFTEECEVVEEITRLQKKFPKANFRVMRNNTRDFWPKKKK